MWRTDGEVAPELFTGLITSLQERPLELNRYRKKSGLGRSQAFGVVLQRNHHYHGSRQNFIRMDLFQQLQELAKVVCPDFDYDGIQLNQDYQTEPHKDKGNSGESLIIGFGDYSGGDLLVEEQPVSIKYQKVWFAGCLYTHSTAPWTGTRYSVVFFKVARNLVKPVYEVVKYGSKNLLKETLGSVVNFYNSRGICVQSSLETIPERKRRSPTLSRCPEVE